MLTPVSASQEEVIRFKAGSAAAISHSNMIMSISNPGLHSAIMPGTRPATLLRAAEVEGNIRAGIGQEALTNLLLFVALHL